MIIKYFVYLIKKSCIIATVPETQMNLPEASFKELEDYNICDAPPRPNAYIRFIEKSTEELDGEVSVFICHNIYF